MTILFWHVVNPQVSEAKEIKQIIRSYDFSPRNLIWLAPATLAYENRKGSGELIIWQLTTGETVRFESVKAVCFDARARRLLFVVGTRAGSGPSQVTTAAVKLQEALNRLVGARAEQVTTEFNAHRHGCTNAESVRREIGRHMKREYLMADGLVVLDTGTATEIRDYNTTALLYTIENYRTNVAEIQFLPWKEEYFLPPALHTGVAYFPGIDKRRPVPDGWREARCLRGAIWNPLLGMTGEQRLKFVCLPYVPNVLSVWRALGGTFYHVAGRDAAWDPRYRELVFTSDGGNPVVLLRGYFATPYDELAVSPDGCSVAVSTYASPPAPAAAPIRTDSGELHTFTAC